MKQYKGNNFQALWLYRCGIRAGNAKRNVQKNIPRNEGHLGEFPKRQNHRGFFGHGFFKKAGRTPKSVRAFHIIIIIRACATPPYNQIRYTFMQAVWRELLFLYNLLL